MAHFHNEELEEINNEFWSNLLKQITDDYGDLHPKSFLDVGCHNGGLLAKLANQWQAAKIYGIEPQVSARMIAAKRLDGLAAIIKILDPEQWNLVPSKQFQVVTCHEVLYLIEDLSILMNNVRRVLTPGGRFYVVLGCHTENPIWSYWKPQLQALGHKVYDHSPIDIMSLGSRCGFLSSVRPLRSAGWVTYDPLQSSFQFPSVSMMLDHHFRHKLLFQFSVQ